MIYTIARSRKTSVLAVKLKARCSYTTAIKRIIDHQQGKITDKELFADKRGDAVRKRYEVKESTLPPDKPRRAKYGKFKPGTWESQHY